MMHGQTQNKFLTLVMDLLLLQSYFHTCDVGSHTRTQRQYCMLTCHFILTATCFVLRPEDGFIHSETCSQAYERAYKLCFDWRFYRFFVYLSIYW